MQVCENIRIFRQLKGWSQEEMAHRLEMSVSGYGGIERGEIDIPLSRLEKIARVFEISLADLFNFNEKNYFHVGDNNTLTHLSQINSLTLDSTILQHELEKSRLLLEQQAKEIELLKQQNTDLRTLVALLQKER
jgi:transcriptional regulator with XRE-family HTH domain